MKLKDQKILTEAVKNKLAQGYKIYAHWDAGGDETPCNVQCINSQEKQWKYEYEGIDIMNELRILIIDKLDLPNAGEIYNKGFGYVTINDKNQLIISYTAKNYFTENWEYKDISQKIVDLPDEYNLAMYLHRARIHFEANLDEEMNFDFLMRVRILEGDELPISQNCHDWYQSFFRKKMTKYQANFEQLIKEKKGMYISIDVNLADKNEITGTLNEEYREIIYSRKDYQEILL